MDVTVKDNIYDDMDSIIPILQVSDGITVPTMGINSGYNAGIFANEPLGVKYSLLKDRLRLQKDMLAKKMMIDDRDASTDHF